MADPTAALLWAACRAALDATDVRAAVEAHADLDAAANLAVAQRVSPLLWRALQVAEVADADASWSATLKRDSARCHAQSRLVLPRIGPLAFAPLARAGLEPLVIKGAALAGRYPDPGLRPMDDIDVVLPEPQIEPAVAALSGSGWTLHETPARQRHEVQLTHPELPGLHLDLHRRMGTWRNRSNRLTTDYLWSSRRATTLYDARAYVLPVDLEVVMLAAHAGKPWHAFDRLIWVADLAVVTANDPPDWDHVARLATAARAQTAVAVALSQAMHLGVDSPERLRRIASPWRAHALAPLLSHDWPVLNHDRDSRASMRYALVDARRTRLQLVMSEILGTTLWAVPRRAYWLARRSTRQYAERERVS
ncbi:MAG TPA: nucleotidyltransferase family protein [Acidimicrobiales bacterium]|nr:nucleotidyltransferase family protein [Acidimicrobiales bacterium]